MFWFEILDGRQIGFEDAGTEFEIEKFEKNNRNFSVDSRFLTNFEESDLLEIDLFKTFFSAGLYLKWIVHVDSALLPEF